MAPLHLTSPSAPYGGPDGPVLALTGRRHPVEWTNACVAGAAAVLQRSPTQQRTAFHFKNRIRTRLGVAKHMLHWHIMGCRQGCCMRQRTPPLVWVWI